MIWVERTNWRIGGEKTVGPHRSRFTIIDDRGTGPVALLIYESLATSQYHSIKSARPTFYFWLILNI